MGEPRLQEVFEKYKDTIIKAKFPIGAEVCSKLGLSLEELDLIVRNLKDFILSFQSQLTENQILINLYELVIGFGLVGFVKGPEREYFPNDFPDTAHNAVECFKHCKILLNNCEDLESSEKTKITVSSLLLCAAHSDIYVWSSELSKEKSSEFVESLLSYTKHKDLSSLLCDDTFYPTIFKRVLKTMSAFWSKNWPENPSLCYAFSWFLSHVKHPYLSEYIDEVFSPPHSFCVSSHQMCHHLLAIRCFSHILDNVPPTLIKLNNRGDVIYYVLKCYINSSDEEMIAALPPLFLKLPDFHYQKANQISWNRYDECLNQLLVRAEMEYNVKIKRLYLSHIQSYIQVMPPFKHLKRLWKLVESTLTEHYDVLCVITVLEILKNIIKSCWPRMPFYCFKILKCLMIFTDGFEDEKSLHSNCEIQNIHSLCEDCLFLLKCACKKEFEDIVMKYVEDENCGELPGVNILKNVLEKS